MEKNYWTPDELNDKLDNVHHLAVMSIEILLHNKHISVVDFTHDSENRSKEERGYDELWVDMNKIPIYIHIDGTTKVANVVSVFINAQDELTLCAVCDGETFISGIYDVSVMDISAEVLIRILERIETMKI